MKLGREAVFAFLSLASVAAAQQGRIPSTPPFTIWDAELGERVSQLPAMDVFELACGTNGGPPSIGLSDFTDYMTCPPEETGLREIYFEYDDEQEYIARAREREYKVLQRGTSVYAHPVIVSILVDGDGTIQGRRIVTDPRVSDRIRRRGAGLMRNFKARFEEVGLTCKDIPPKEGENPIGDLFVHEVCTGSDEQASYRLEATYLRKPGQRAVNPDTQELYSSYFESKTRLEMVSDPYQPAPSPQVGRGRR